MVQVVPRFDPGGEIGSALGSGIGEGLNQYVDRERMLKGLDYLSNLDLENMSYGDLVKESAKGFVGIQGGMQLLQEILPALIKQKQSLDYANSYENIDANSKNKIFDNLNLPENLGQSNLDQPNLGQSNLDQPNLGQGGRQELKPEMQNVPGLQEGIPAYKPMNPQERKAFAKQMARGGFSPDEIRKGIQDEENRRLQQWEALTKAKKERAEQFREERGLENEQRNFVNESLKTELGISKDSPQQLDPYESQKGYELFKKYQEKSPHLTDQQIWNLARKEFNNMRESFAKGQILMRPGLLSGDSERRLKIARDWAQDHLKKYGNFRQDREKLISMFMQNGFTRTEAQSIVRPMSSELKNVINKTEKAHRLQLPFRPDQVSQKPLRNENDQRIYLSNLSDEIAKNIQPTDSLLLLRDQLIREKGLKEEDFDTVLKDAKIKMNELGKTFNEEQSAEVPFLQERVIPSLYQMLFEGEFDIRKFFPRMAR